MKNRLLTLFIVFLTTSLFAQQIRVFDKSDLSPISGVNITNLEKTSLVSTDANGRADISIFKDGDMLVFSHVAFQTTQLSKSSILQAGSKVYMTENIIKLDEVVFTANKVEEKKSDLPYKMEVIQQKTIRFNNPQTSAAMLEQTGEVFVQQSQMGGGSPVLRGLEANKVLLVIDGIRMNNAIYRAGHLQNAITVDPNMLASTEVLFGPGSTLYGSDALGGVINFSTIDPQLSGNGKMKVKGNVFGRYGSANQEKTGGITLNLGLKKWAFLGNFSYSDFGDLREGKVRNPFYGDWGKCLFYTERINGKDSMMVNDKPEIQKRSGYSQYNGLLKVLFVPGSKSRYTLNLQYSNSSDIPRYDRLTEMVGDTILKYAEWYYGPQKRLLASLKAEYKFNAILFDQASFIAGYQKLNEDRINRRFGKSSRKFNLEEVDVISFNADFDKKLFPKDQLRYGLEFFYNQVGSTAHQENIKTGKVTEDVATRYPDAKADMMNLSAYLSNRWNINKVLNFSQGLRFTYTTLNAAWSDTMMNLMKFPFNKEVSRKNTALNGYLSLVATPGHEWKFSLIGSSGFRAPNIDDVGKVNDSNSQDQLIIVPNPEVKPEYAYNLELSVGKTILGAVRLEGSVYYTWLTNAIVLAPYKYNGQDSIMFDGVMCQVQANTNTGKAYIYGFQASLLAQVTKAFSIVSNLTYTVGRDTENDAPLDHIPPFFGMTSFRMEIKKFRGDFYVMYNGWKRIGQYSPSGEDNQTYATIHGMPSWYTLNLKASYQIIRNINIEAGIENILDEHYRKFASGISSPGRNVFVALRASL
ncbi:MAG: TonB-dependent receptor [Bacteroidetes bacterium]|nr:TonB-dependent receptor [Bacteroidota bacterium]